LISNFHTGLKTYSGGKVPKIIFIESSLS